MDSILLVEDKAELREMLATALGRMGYEVSPAAGVPDALTALRKRRFSAVLTDLKLPPGSGMDVLHAALEHGIANFLRSAPYCEGDRGLTIFFYEGRGVDVLTLIPRRLEALGSDHALRWHDFAENALAAHFASVGAAPNIAIGAARPEVNLADGHSVVRPAG